MNVLLVHNRYRQAGGEDAVFRAERRMLEKRGHEVAVYERSNDEIDGYDGLRRGSLPLRTVWAWDSRRALEALIRRRRPDVAHFHNTFPLISPAAYAVCRARGVPVVQTLHNYRLLCPGGTLTRDGRTCRECVDHSLARSVRHGCYRGSRLGSAVVAASLTAHRRRGTWARDVNVYVALSEDGRARFADLGLPAQRIAVKPNFLASNPGRREGDGDYALFVGRLSEEKGVATLLSAWRARSCPPPLRIAGDGPLRGLVEAAAREIDAVDFLGWLEPSKILDQIRGARFIVVPSEWYETFGMVVIEAFACGVPVLVSRMGSLPELVDDGRTGLVFDPGDPDALADCADRAWRDVQGLRAMGRAARDEFEEHYTAERNHDLLMQIYDRARREAAP